MAAASTPWRTIGCNVNSALETMGFDKSEQDRRVARVLDLVIIGRLREGNIPWQALGGMTAAASIARGAGPMRTSC